jgi:uncharacterized lipoprotein YmbA
MRAILLIPIVLIAVATGGCGASAPSHFYTLTPVAISNNAPPVHASVMVGPVSVPASVDRPEFVVQAAPNRVEVEEFNRWAAPLSDGIANTIAGNLALLLGAPNVAATPLANFDPDYRVTIDVQRFESSRGRAVLVDALWVVRKRAGGETRAGRTLAQEPVQGDSFEALAAAHSRALGTISGNIAEAIRTEADENRRAGNTKSPHQEKE